MHVPTPYGVIRGRLVEIEGRSVFLLSRHSAGHSVPPHLVNYRAMAVALRQLGVKFCFASAAVGSLSLSLPIGSMVVCADFLDLSFRNLTLHDRKVVHTPFAEPFGVDGRAALLEGALLAGIVVRDGGVYLGLNGPRFETPHEIQILAKVGDVVGMTAATEAVIMKEAGIQYGLLSIVTNLGEGLGGQVDHEMVGDAMLELGPKAVAIFKQAIGVLPR